MSTAELLRKEALLTQWEKDLTAREEALRRSQTVPLCSPASTHEQLKLRVNSSSGSPSSPNGSPSKERVPPLSIYICSGKFIRSAVFGGLDGLTTSIVLICSTSGLVRSDSHTHEDHSKAHISAAVLFTLGAANLLADAFSMGMGDFLSSLAEAEHGNGNSSTPRPWRNDPALVEAARNGAVMFLSFVIFGVLPLTAYAPFLHLHWLTDQRRFIAACVLGIISLFFLGLLKGYVTVTHESWGISNANKRRAMIASATKMVLTGSIASLISFVVSLELHTTDESGV